MLYHSPFALLLDVLSGRTHRLAHAPANIDSHETLMPRKGASGSRVGQSRVGIEVEAGYEDGPLRKAGMWEGRRPSDSPSLPAFLLSSAELLSSLREISSPRD